MFNSATTRLWGGLTNAAPWQTMANSGIPDPSWAHVYHNDFDSYVTTDWTVTLVGTGTTALAVGVDGGAILQTTSIGIADSIFNQLVQASFKMLPGKSTYFKFAGILSDVLNSVFYCGLMAKTATPLTVTDGLYILKATAQAGLTLVSVIGGVTTSTPLPAACVLAAGVAFELGLEVDYLGNVAAYWNPSTGNNQLGLGTIPLTTSNRGRVASLTGVTVSQVVLSPSFGILNSTAVARTLQTDYVTAVRER